MDFLGWQETRLNGNQSADGMKTTRPRACTFESEAAKTQDICCGQVADFTKAYRLRQDSGACRMNSGRALIVDPPSSWAQLSTKPTGGHSWRWNKAVDPFLPVSHFTLVHPHSQTSSRQSSSPFLDRAAVPRGSVDFFCFPPPIVFQPSISLYRVSCLGQEPTRLNPTAACRPPSPSRRRAIAPRRASHPRFSEPSPSSVWTVGLEEKTVVGVCRVDRAKV